VWPSHVLRLFDRAGLPRKRLPSITCDDVAPTGRAPEIQSPQPDLTYVWRGATTTLPLLAAVEGETKRVHWFAGTRYLGETSANEPLEWHPLPGTHVIRAVDTWGALPRGWWKSSRIDGCGTSSLGPRVHPEDGARLCFPLCAPRSPRTAHACVSPSPALRLP